MDLVWSGLRRTAGERFSHLARHYRGGTMASSFFYFYVETMAPSRA